MHQLVLQLGYLLDLLALLELELQQLYCEILVVATGGQLAVVLWLEGAVGAGLWELEARNGRVVFLPLWDGLVVVGGQHVEDGIRHVMLVEVHLIVGLLPHPRVDQLWRLLLPPQTLQLLYLLPHLHKLQLQRVQNLQLLYVKQFLLIRHPHLLQLDVEEIVENLLDLVLRLKLADQGEGRRVMPFLTCVGLRVILGHCSL